MNQCIDLKAVVWIEYFSSYLLHLRIKDKSGFMFTDGHKTRSNKTQTVFRSKLKFVKCKASMTWITTERNYGNKTEREWKRSQTADERNSAVTSFYLRIPIIRASYPLFWTITWLNELALYNLFKMGDLIQPNQRFNIFKGSLIRWLLLSRNNMPCTVISYHNITTNNGIT